jgi:5'-3' exonuclease
MLFSRMHQATHEAHFSIVRTRRFTQQSPAQIEAERVAQAAAAAAEAGQQGAEQEPEEEPDMMADWQLLHIPVVREYLYQEFAPFLRQRVMEDFGETVQPLRASRSHRLTEFLRLQSG